ncbi:MAG: VOC family protein [Phreatobacter sp.]|nr:VOC family protein [Phreatobacter sp.]
MDKAPPNSEIVPPLVPELVVSNLDRSLAFWLDALGFRIRFERPEHRFGYLMRGSAHIMLVERRSPDHPRGETWTGGPLEPPFGRGINFQISVDDVDVTIAALRGRNWPLFREPRDAWYRKDDVEVGQRELMFQDPDGYLIRFAQPLGQRPFVS